MSNLSIISASQPHLAAFLWIHQVAITAERSVNPGIVPRLCIVSYVGGVLVV
jgi:hypothetical protein